MLIKARIPVKTSFSSTDCTGLFTTKYAAFSRYSISPEYIKTDLLAVWRFNEVGVPHRSLYTVLLYKRKSRTKK